MRFKYWFLVLIGSLISSNVLAGEFGRGGWSGHMSGAGMIFGPLMMLGFIVIIIFLIVLIVRLMGGASQVPAGHQAQSALEILNERFAKGEIEKEEYEERKRLLSS